jgi:hypothetical protein
MHSSPTKPRSIWFHRQEDLEKLALSKPGLYDWNGNSWILVEHCKEKKLPSNVKKEASTK